MLSDQSKQFEKIVDTGPDAKPKDQDLEALDVDQEQLHLEAETEISDQKEVATVAKAPKKEAPKDPNEEREEKLATFDRRGIQTLFRTLSRNHYHLLRMIDAKARIILTINSIIISLLKGALFIAPQSTPLASSLGSGILVNCCMISMVFAVISMLPHRYFHRKLKGSGYQGSLYAANIAQKTLEEFHKEINRIMTSGQTLYDEMVKDIFFLSKAIKGKQQLLIISFGIFLFGIIGTIIFSTISGFSIMTM